MYVAGRDFHAQPASPAFNSESYMSPRTWKPLIAVGALAIVAACADERSPAATTPVGPSLALNYAGCDFTQIRKDAKGYFVSQRDPVYELNQLLSTQYKGSGAARSEERRVGKECRC